MSSILLTMYSLIIVLTVAVFCNAQIIEVWEATNLSAVTQFETIQQYYETRRQQPVKIPPPEPSNPVTKIQLKKKICESILTSHFFRMLELDWVNVELKGIQLILRSKFRDVFDAIFEEYQIRYLPILAYGFVYKNEYRRVRVQVSDELKAYEYVFTCVARDRATKKLMVYYVSQAYDVNEVNTDEQEKLSYPIAGRFIFPYNEDKNNDLNNKVFAMAEDGAIESQSVRLSKVATLYYVLQRWNTEPDNEPDEDPVCTLSPVNKLRLCASFFGVEAFKNKVVFKPVLDNVLPNCQKRTVSIFFWEVVRKRPFEEWVIGCKATTARNNEIIFYISGGVNEANTIFVYLDAGRQKLAVYNFCNCVSVVDAHLLNIVGASEDGPPSAENELMEGEENTSTGKQFKQDVETKLLENLSTQGVPSENESMTSNTATVNSSPEQDLEKKLEVETNERENTSSLHTIERSEILDEAHSTTEQLFFREYKNDESAN